MAQGQQLGDHAQVVVGDVDGHPLHGLVDLAVDQPGHHLGLAHGELEALAAHGLDQHGQLELAAALDLPGVGSLGGRDPQRDVADQFGVESPLHQPGRELGAVGARQRATS